MQLDSKKIVIGGGLSGLCWKFYHPEVEIITPEIGGQAKSNHLVWIHDMWETRKLLKDLGWSNPEKFSEKSYIGYYYKGWIFDYLIPEMNLLLIQKKMTEWNKSVDYDYVPKSKDMSLSMIGGENYLKSLNVDMGELINRLSSNIKTIPGSIVEIDESFLIVINKDSQFPVSYETLISTIPAPYFWSAYCQPKKFKSMPVTNVIVSNKPKFFDNRYSMIYYDDTLPCSRISYLQGKWAFEFTGIITKEEFSKLYPDLTIVDYSVIKFGRILPDGENLPPKNNIIFSGRFSKWEYGITIEQVISQVLSTKL